MTNPVTVLRFHEESSALNAESDLQNLHPLCQNLMQILEKDANTLMQNANKGIFDSIADFVLQQNLSTSSMSLGIPTSLILSGVNMQDHSMSFSELGNVLQERTPCAFAVLQPSQCKSLDNCIDSLFQQFASSSLKHRSSNGSYSMAMLKSWFEENSSSHGDIPLVILIREVENFPPQVLTDFISVCSNNSRAFEKNGLPFVFLLAVSSSQHSLRLLPASCSNKLQVEFGWDCMYLNYDKRYNERAEFFCLLLGRCCVDSCYPPLWNFWTICWSASNCSRPIYFSSADLPSTPHSHTSFPSAALSYRWYIFNAP